MTCIATSIFFCPSKCSMMWSRTVWYFPMFHRIVVFTPLLWSSPRISWPRNEGTATRRNVANYPTTQPHIPGNYESLGFILLVIYTSVSRLKVIYLFYNSMESLIHDIIHRFLKALFLLVVLVHTGNKVILRSQIATVESPHCKRLMMWTNEHFFAWSGICIQVSWVS